MARIAGAHATAIVTTVAVPAVVGTVFYFLLLAWAILANEPVGSPIALPLGLLFIVGATLAYAALVCTPASLVGDLVAARIAGARGLAIGACTALLLAILGTWGLVWLLGWYRASVPPSAKWVVGGVGIAAFLVYWVSLQAADALLRVGSYAIRTLYGRVVRGRHGTPTSLRSGKAGQQ